MAAALAGTAWAGAAGSTFAAVAAGVGSLAGVRSCLVGYVSEGNYMGRGGGKEVGMKGNEIN